MLIIISGLSGAGKDAIADKLLKHPAIKALKISRLVTYTDRLPRSGELNGYDYNFVTPKELDDMHKNGLLAEDPVSYGTSRKATGKEQLKAVIEGKNKLWRIDPSLTLKIAQENYFEKIFNTEIANKIYKNSVIFFLVADHNQIDERRKKRDGNSYNETDYKIRDNQDQEILSKFNSDRVNIINNPDGELDSTLEKMVNILVRKMNETDIPKS